MWQPSQHKMSNELVVVDIAEKSFTAYDWCILDQTKIRWNRHSEAARTGGSVDMSVSRDNEGPFPRQLSDAVVGTGPAEVCFFPEEFCFILIHFKTICDHPTTNLHNTLLQWRYSLACLTLMIVYWNLEGIYARIADLHKFNTWKLSWKSSQTLTVKTAVMPFHLYGISMSCTHPCRRLRDALQSVEHDWPRFHFQAIHQTLHSCITMPTKHDNIYIMTMHFQQITSLCHLMVGRTGLNCCCWTNDIEFIPCRWLKQPWYCLTIC